MRKIEEEKQKNKNIEFVIALKQNAVSKDKDHISKRSPTKKSEIAE
jgi:hypothetical protein